jgi:D-alanyl-D-alanine carboxypeptidase
VSSSVPARPRRPIRPIALALVLVLLTSTGAAGQLPSQAELERAQRRGVELRGQVQSAAAELREVEARLEELEAERAEAEAELRRLTDAYEVANAAANEAADAAADAAEQLEAARAAQAENQVELNDLARDTYKYGAPTTSPLLAVLGSADTTSEEGFSDRVHYLQRGVGVRAVALERSEALAREIMFLSDRAQMEADEADRARAEAEDLRDQAAAAHARVEDLVSQVSAALDRSIELLSQLEGAQAENAQRVQVLEQRVAEERAEAERRERERREREARERAERERQEREARERAAREQAERERQEREAAERRAAQQRSASSSSSSSSSGGSSSGSGSSSSGSGSSSGGSSSGGGGGSSSGGGGGSTAIRPGPTPNLVTVGGITVAASLGPNLQALLDHARRDGIVLGGHGYRSPEVQARLRLANGCPDVYTSPASSCRVPTAIPGNSEHEKGLAVDFTWQGRTICYPRSAASCSGNAAFDWLRANAGRYGLRNLPTEAWHWSTTGR